MPLNGIEAAREIIRYCPNAIILSDNLHDVELISRELREAGVRGFVQKVRIETDLIPTVEAVLNGKTGFVPRSGRSN
jgi:DNA-binding NarL/FixJ family response regulator